MIKVKKNMPNFQLQESGFFKLAKRISPKTLWTASPSLINIGILGFTFLAVHYWYKMLTEIASIDFNEFILAESPTQFFKGTYWLLLPLLGLFLVLLWRRKLLLLPWNTFEGGSNLRWAVGACVVLLAWAHITYPFAFFLDEIAYLERSIILVFAILTLWRPFFFIFYLLFPIIFHFGEPLLVNHWSIGELPMRVLTLFFSQLVVWLIYPKSRWSISAFVFLLFCILAGNYFPAGLGKLKIGWLTKNHIYLLLPNMYADGWLSFLDSATLSKFTLFLSKYNLLLKIGTLMIEFGCLFILVRKSSSIRFFLIGYMLFHTLVYIMTGICFWPWVIFEFILLRILWKKGAFYKATQGFTIWHFVLSVFLIGTATKWLRPSVYVWHDSPVNYTYTFEVEDTTGKISDLPSHYFWPKYYEHAWTNGFHFLHESPTLNIIWGVSFEEKEVNELLALTTDQEILAYEKVHGTNHLNPKLEEAFKNYMIEFAQKKKYKLTLNPWFKAISAPPQRIIFPTATTYDGKNDIVNIDIYQELSFYNKQSGYHEVKKLKVLSIAIPSQ